MRCFVVLLMVVIMMFRCVFNGRSNVMSWPYCRQGKARETPCSGSCNQPKFMPLCFE